MTNAGPSSAPPRTAPPARRPRGFAASVDATTRPRLLIATLALGAYWPALLQGFAVDDYRNLRRLHAFTTGQADSPRLYEFLLGGEDNRAQRREGWIPWWAGDDFRFIYFRPLTQAFVTAEYRVFGEHPFGYHLVGFLLFLASVFAALALFRRWTGHEALSRWAAVCFAVASCNAVPVAFIAAQCDLLAVLFSLLSALGATAFLRGGSSGAWWAIVAMALHAAGILCKEVAVAGAALPALYVVATWTRMPREQRPRVMRRAALLLAALGAMSAALVVFYGRARYGSNGSMLLDPIGHPLEYLSRMPGRALLLLGSWLAPVNPQWFDLYTWMWPLAAAFMVGAAIGLIAVARVLRRRPDPATTWAFAGWAVVFLPLLACTNPDNRVMMLPTAGLSVLAAKLIRRSEPPGLALASVAGRPVTEMTGQSAETADRDPANVSSPGAGGGSTRPHSRLALAAFVFAPFFVCCGTVASLGNLEHIAVRNVRAAVDTFDPPPARDDFVFFLNTYWQFDLLWCQDRVDWLWRCAALRGDPRIAFLSHMRRVRPVVLGPRTLRLVAESEPFFSTFPGRLAAPRGGLALSAGTRYDAGEFAATLSEVSDEEVRAVDFEFRQPLDSPRYRFFLMQVNDPPVRWTPPTESAPSARQRS